MNSEEQIKTYLIDIRLVGRTLFLGLVLELSFKHSKYHWDHATNKK
jgi:hypothetical protein